MRQLKNSRFFSVSAEYLKNGRTYFHQTYVIFRQLYKDVSEIKIEDRPFIVVMVINSLRRAGLKIMI